MKYKFLISVFTASLLVSCNNHKQTNAHNHHGMALHFNDDTAIKLNQDDYFGNYTLNDVNYGTKTAVSVKGNTRTMITNALPNHKTGEFPNQGNPNTISEQQNTYTFPVNPKYIGKAQWIREPGIALNGIKFEPGTAEVVVCDSGENFRVEALQDVIDLGLDFNHAHVQPTGAYHYHGTPTSVIENFETGDDLVHIGFAHDGYPMYYSKSGQYKPSFKALDGTREGEDCRYENPHQSIAISVGGHHDGTFTSDYEYVDGYGDLDECNGITIDGNYMYLVTAEFPYVSRCLMGEVSENQQQGSPSGQVGRGVQSGHAGPPSIDQLFEQMDANKDGKLSKAELKGPLVHDFSKLDTDNDGYLSKEELEKAPKPQGRRPGGRQ